MPHLRLACQPLPRPKSVGCIVAIAALLFGVVAQSAPKSVYSGSDFIDALPAATAHGDLESQKTGAFSYSFPIDVPPGRLGMQPHVSLGYSSDAPIYGGIASGWSLSVPSIELDTNDGILAGEWRWRSGLAGGERLIETPDPHSSNVSKVYRARYDASGTRYERQTSGQPFEWVVRGLDGTIYRFGRRETGVPTDVLAVLGQIEDKHGNVVDYWWKWGDVSLAAKLTAKAYALSSIEYTKNPAAGLGTFARVEFAYEYGRICPGAKLPVGSQLSVRTGVPIVDGYFELKTISTYTTDRTTPNGVVRRYDLHYDENAAACDQDYAPRRQLTSIGSTGWAVDGTTVVAKPVTFAYGPIIDRWETDEWRVTEDGGRELHASNNMFIDADLVDIDGDGRLDRLTSAGDETCDFYWQRNTGSAFEGERHRVHRPSLPYGDEPSNWVLDDFSDNVTNGLAQRCALNAQYTLVKSPSLADPDAEACRVGGLFPYEGKDYRAGTVVNWRFMDIDHDGLPDLVAGVDINELAIDSSNPGFEDSGLLEYDLDQVTNVSFTKEIDDAIERARDAYAGDVEFGCKSLIPRKVGNWYQWVVFRNEGDGHFADEPVRWGMPVPVVAAGGASRAAIGSSQAVDAYAEVSRDNGIVNTTADPFSFVDVDGDGFEDIVSSYKTRGEGDGTEQLSRVWRVARGVAAGAFAGRGVGDPFKIEAPAGEHPNGTVIDDFNPEPGSLHVTSMSPSGLQDINGDGVPDFVWMSSDNYDLENYSSWKVASHAWLGAGSAILTGAAGQDDIGSAVELAAPLKVADGGVAALASRAEISFVTYPHEGARWTKSRLVDIDADGRDDLVSQEVLGGPVTVRLNGGGVFLPPRPAPSFIAAAVLDSEETPPMNYPSRRQHAMFADIDSDGRLDAMFASVNEPHSWTVRRQTSRGPGLLQSVCNGVGGCTYVTYSSSRDTSVVESWGIPGHRWVVGLTATTAGDGSPAQFEYYAYGKPAWRADDDGRFGFRGFERVDVETPTGARISQTFGYDQFYGGLPAETAVVDLTVQGEAARTVDTQSWERHDFLGSPLYVPYRRDHRVCSNGHTVQKCRTNGALLRSQTTWKEIRSPDQVPRVLAVTQEELVEGEDVAALGSTVTSSDFAFYVSGDVVRMATKSIERRERTEAGEVLAGRVELDYDPTLRRLVEQRVRVDEDRVASTRYGYDVTTGIVTSIQRPESVAAGANLVTTIVPDARKVYALKTINELGHTTAAERDLGTGLVLLAAGPQYKCLRGGVSCPESSRVWRKSTWRYDGLGRLRDRAESFDSPLGDYDLWDVERRSYVDWSGTFPAENKVVTETRIDATHLANWTKSELISDGLARPVRQIVSTFSASTPDAVTVYHWDSRGLVTSIEVPDPSKTDTSRTSMLFEYDGLGRVTQTSSSSGAGGVLRIVRDGLWTVSQRETTDGGPAPAVTYRSDMRGRIVEVQEKTSSEAGAPTEYAYDANDHVRQIIDADGLVTTMNHDYAGNRRWVERAGRRWTMTYDLEGRAKTSLPPHDGGADAAYTTRIEYDAIGRVKMRHPAPGTLTPEEQAELGVGDNIYVYDAGTAWIGFLTSISAPALIERFKYDAHGDVTSADQHFTAAGTPQDVLGFTAVYNAHGNVTSLTHTEMKAVTYTYDRRGLAKDVRMAELDIASQSRNSAGLVMKRITRFTSSTPGTVSNFGYDTLGRLHSLGVKTYATGIPIEIASQNSVLYDSGDVHTTAEKILSSARNFVATYDQQSQIKNIHDDRGYLAAYDYTPAGRLLTQQLSVPASADTQGRNVVYAYDEVDLERLRALTNAQTGADVVTLAYDAAGAVTHRTDATGSATLKYDGEGRLRIVTRGTTRETYIYDAAGRRVLARHEVSGTVDKTRRWFSDIEVTTVGFTTPTIDLTISLGTPVARTRNGALELLHHNSTGNLLVATNALGAPVAAFSYGAFGEILEKQQQSSKFQRRYQDRERDDMSGFYNYGHRLYDPQTLLWNRADPLFQLAPDAAGLDPRRMSLYAFNLNNPLRYVDPDGQNPVAAAWSWFSGVVSSAWNGIKNAVSSGYRTFASAARTVAAQPGRLVHGVVESSVRTMVAHGGWCERECVSNRKQDEKAWGAVKEIALVAVFVVLPELLVEMRGVAAAERAVGRAVVQRGESVAGAFGGRWVIRNEVRGAAVGQITNMSCGAACAEMLTGVRQAELLAAGLEAPTGVNALARAMGRGWRPAAVAEEARAVQMASKEPWIAQMKDFGESAHYVVVDGQRRGHMLIRDPWAGGSSYEMPTHEFDRLWNGLSVRR
jgi:RHS repeat-associated protein